jgi:Spy/CpxP family protein refolding chaperone
MTDPNKKYKALVFIIIFLLISNFVLLALLMSNNSADKKETRHDQKGLHTMLQQEVGFSDAQLSQYQALRTQQRKTIKPLFNTLRSSKENFYELLYNDTLANSILYKDADSIAATQKQIDLQMFDHFKKIRNICTPQQVPKFDSSIKKVIARMISWPGKSKADHK